MVVVDGAVVVVLAVEEVGMEVVAVVLALLLSLLVPLFSPASSLLLFPILSVAGIRAGAEEGPGWSSGGGGPVPGTLIGTGTTPVTEGPEAVGGKEVAAVGAAAGVRLNALTVLLVNPSPRTTLLNISSTFICRLFSRICFLPFVAVLPSSPGAATVVAAPRTGPKTEPPNLKVGCGGGVARGENRPCGRGLPPLSW